MQWLHEISGTEGDRFSRRRFLQLSAVTVLAGTAPRLSFAAVRDGSCDKRSLSFYETHTGESLKTIYCINGEYQPGALADINHILRDFRTGEVKLIDTRLLDLLHAIKLKLDTNKPFHVISGYRSAKTNALLHKRNKGVAKNSLHIYGKAIDLRLPGCTLCHLRRMAIDLRGGGVGYYPRPDFVHLDVGRVRYW